MVLFLIKICHLHNISLLFLFHASSCFHNICDLRRFCNTVDQTTDCTIATSLIHSKIDYYNSLLLNLHATETNRLQLVFNYAARAVTKTPKLHHNTAILGFLLWLKISKRIKNKFLSHTCKFVKTGQPSYISLLSFPSNRSTRSPSLITLSRPSLTSRLDLSIILLLFCGTVSRLIYVTLLITSLLRLY